MRLPGGRVPDDIGYDMNGLITGLNRIDMNVFMASQQYINRGVRKDKNLKDFALGTRKPSTQPDEWNARVKAYETVYEKYYKGRNAR